MESIKNQSKIKCIIKGLIIAILSTIIALSLFSIALVNTKIGEETIQPVVLIVISVSILIGSSMGIKRIKTNGVLNGGFVGGLYIFIVYLVTSIASSDFSLDINSIIMTCVGIICGIIGGIIGINITTV